MTGLIGVQLRKSLPISLIVPCFERHRQTHDLLASLDQADFACEIVLIDDASPRPLDEVVAAYPRLGITYIRNEQNAGPASSRNLGVARAGAEFLAFTDNDCCVAKDWLPHIYGSIAGSPSDIGGVGGRVVAAGKDLVSRYYDYHKILDPWYFRGKFYYLTTANAIFKRHAFEVVGGFDESVRQAGGEDPGLCFKLQNAGYGLGYNPDALIYHQYESSIRAFMRTFYRYGYGCAGQSAKHFRPQPFRTEGSFGALDIPEDT